MYTFYEYPKCSTCRKAKAELDQLGLDVESINIKENPPSAQLLKKLLAESDLELKKFFNTSGLIYKQENLKDKIDKMSKEEKIKILSTNGMLLKRPLVIDKDTILVGFKKEQWIEKLK